MSRGSSRRLIPEPKSVVMAGPPSPLARRAGRGPNRGDDVLVAGAAAEIALERVPDLGVARMRVLTQQVGGGHDHSRGAEPALQSVFVPERLLQGVQPAVRAEPLDGRDLATLGL